MVNDYKIDGFDVLDFEDGVQKKWYIRAILDVTSCEFEHSELTNEKRVAIVEALGIERLECVLEACFKETHPEYSAADEVILFTKTVGLYAQGKEPMTEKDTLKLKLEALHRKMMSSLRS